MSGGDHPAPGWLAPVLTPAGLLYGAATGLRNVLYDRGWLRAQRVPRPVISVGNLTTGGTGKTPLTALIAGRLLAAGVPCAVLSRGFGRASRRPRVVAPGEALPGWREIGDEPWLIGKRLAQVALGIDADRRRSAARLAPLLDGGVFILDDGFQHRRIARDLDIVTVAAGSSLRAARMLPAGNLRESAASLARAGLVVITGADDPAAVAEARASIGRLAGAAQVVTARTVWDGLVPAGDWVGSGRLPGGRPGGEAGGAAAGRLPGATAGDGRPVLLVSGIARPGRFRGAATAAGLEIAGQLRFADHHRFTAADAQAIDERARRLGAARVVTTEKDAPRLAPVWAATTPLQVALTSLRIADGDRLVWEAIAAACGCRADRLAG
jgi:tetraacyldisaccharide 4'-kinase